MSFAKLRARDEKGQGSQTMRQQVLIARERQSSRFGVQSTECNATMSHRQVEKFCPLNAQGEMLLKQAMTEFGLSARAHDKICKVARTIADLAEVEAIRSEDIAEAVSYRRLDRRF